MQFINAFLNASITITFWVLIFTTAAMVLDITASYLAGVEWAPAKPIALLPPAAEPVAIDLGPELEPVAILAAIERHVPAAAQAITAPVAVLAVLTVEIDEAELMEQYSGIVNYPGMKVAELRVHCTEAGIVWRNAHGKNRHLKKAEMVEALEDL